MLKRIIHIHETCKATFIIIPACERIARNDYELVHDKFATNSIAPLFANINARITSTKSVSINLSKQITGGK